MKIWTVMLVGAFTWLAATTVSHATTELERCKNDIRKMWEQTIEEMPKLIEKKIQRDLGQELLDAKTDEERKSILTSYILGRALLAPLFTTEFYRYAIMPNIEAEMAQMRNAQVCWVVKEHTALQLEQMMEQIKAELDKN